MDICSFLKNYRVAGSGDLSEVAEIANSNPGRIMVREMMNDQFYPLSTVAKGPFLVSVVEQHQTLSGYDLKGAEQKIRIVDGVIEILNDRFKIWSAVSMGSIRLYLPIK